jgi:steroid delta-isomerase-like uncharacterized protein
MPEDVQRILDTVIQLWNTGDTEIAKQLYTERAERHDPDQADPGRDRQAIMRYISEVRVAYPDFKLEIDDIVAHDDRLVARWTCTGTHESEFMGIPATGKRIRITGITLNRIENGKIAEERIYFDRLALLEQLGASPDAAGNRANRATG